MFSLEKADAARIRIPIGSYENVKKVFDLPQDEMYTTDKNEHFDLGVIYTVYQVCWIPVWTQESPRLVGYINNDSSCFSHKKSIATLLSNDNEVVLNN